MMINGVEITQATIAEDQARAASELTYAVGDVILFDHGEPRIPCVHEGRVLKRMVPTGFIGGMGFSGHYKVKAYGTGGIAGSEVIVTQGQLIGLAADDSAQREARLRRDRLERLKRFNPAPELTGQFVRPGGD